MNRISLDDPGVRERLDSQSMLDLLRAVPEQCAMGWRLLSRSLTTIQTSGQQAAHRLISP